MRKRVIVHLQITPSSDSSGYYRRTTRNGRSAMSFIIIIAATALFAILAGLATTAGTDSRLSFREDVRPWI
jgi:hypothetical protein